MQRPAHHAAVRQQQALGLLNLAAHGQALLVERSAQVGQHHLAGGAAQQLHACGVLEVLDAAADVGAVHAQAPRGRGKTACFHDLGKK